MSDTKIKTSNIGNLAVTHALLHTDMDLTSKTVQVATPTSNTHPATKAYVDTEVANLIDSAPGTLDTLNELAAAVNDDANFNATIASSIATKLPLAGGTMTGNLTAPNIIATGDMFISSTSPKLKLTDTDTADEYTELQNNNGNTIIDTRNGTENGQFIIRGLGGGTVDEFGRFDELGRFGVGTSNPDHLLHVGNVLNSLGTTAGDSLSNFRIQSDTSHNDSLLFTAQRLADGTGWTTAAQRIQRNVDTTLMGYMEFGHNIDALITFGKESTERVRIDGAGNVGIGTGAPGDSNEGAGLRVHKYVDRAQYYSPAGSYAGSFGYTNNTNTKTWLSVDSGYNQTSSVSAGLFLSPFHSDANGSFAGHTIKSIRDGGALLFSRVNTATSTGTAATESEHMRINGSGNVGIGTDAPDQKLHVYGSSGNTYAKLESNANNTRSANLYWSKKSDGSTLRGYVGVTGDANKMEIATTTNDPIHFYTNNNPTNNGIFLKADGNVGIGTSSPSQIFHVQKAADDKLVYGSNPRLLLDTPTGINGLRVLGDTTPFEFKIDSGTYNGSAFQMGGTGDLSFIGTTTTASDTFNDSPTFFFNSQRWNGSANSTHFQGAIKGHTRSATNGDGYLGIGANASANHINIDASTGNVGIGTTNPATKLHISGASENIRLHNTGTGNYGLEIWRGSNKGASIAWGEGNANLEIKNYRNDSQPDGPYANIDFFTGGTNATSPNYNPDLRMRIQQTGEVGIGTSNPTAKLHVVGTIYATGDITKASGVKYEPEYQGYVLTSDNNYKLLARISNGSGYCGACEFNMAGTTNSTVFQTVGVASSNHSYDGSIVTHVTSHYSGVKIKIVSDGNNQFELYVAVNTAGSNNVGISYTIRKLNGNVTMAPSSAAYSSGYLVHTAGNNTVTTSSLMPSGSGPTAY